MYDCTHAVSDCTHARPPVCCRTREAKIKGSPAVVLSLLCVCGKCTQVRGRNKEPVVRVLLCGCVGRYLSVVAGVTPIMVHTHVCFVRKEQLLQSFAWMCQPIHLFVLQNASCYLGPFHLTVHTHVCCRSQDWRSQLPFAVLALVAVYEYARTCAGRGKQSAVSVPATAIG